MGALLADANRLAGCGSAFVVFGGPGRVVGLARLGTRGFRIDGEPSAFDTPGPAWP